MPDTSGTPVPARESWLVGPKKPEFAVSGLVARIEQDPHAELERVVHLSDGAEVLVVAMDEATAQRYQRELGDRYHFERNLPLHH